MTIHGIGITYPGPVFAGQPVGPAFLMPDHAEVGHGIALQVVIREYGHRRAQGCGEYAAHPRNWSHETYVNGTGTIDRGTCSDNNAMD